MQEKINLSKFILLFVCLFGSFQLLLAQQININGKVTGADSNDPLIGATVALVGSQTGTVTDVEGNYGITAKEGDTLLFSYVGYLSERVIVSENSTIDVVLLPDVAELEGVVVVGYGTQRKEDLTGAVSVVDNEQLTQSNAPTLGQALQGRAAGVSVTNNSGQPGAQTSIKVRGIGSISNSTSPLFVIDGVITENSSILNSINPADIESVSVLKDASATAIYGARGANGVVVVTTKKGASGETSVLFSSYFGITQIPQRYDLLSAEEYADFTAATWEGFLKYNPGQSSQFFYTDSARNANNAASTNWQDLILQTGQVQNYNLSLRSGKDKLTYMLGLNYYAEEGILINTGFERISGRLNSDLEVFDWLNIGQRLSYSVNDHEYTSHRGENPWRTATITSPFMHVYDENNIGGYAGPYDYLTGPNDKSNPYAEQQLNTNLQTTNQLLGNIYTEITFFPGLTYKFDVGINYRLNYDYRYSPEYELARAWSNPSSVLNESYGRSFNSQINNLLTYENTFNNHNISILLGQSGEAGNFRSLGVEARNISFGKEVVSLAQTIGNATGIETDVRFSSLFARFLYNYQSKYLLTATIRRDGSSRFGPGNRYGYFPSFSLGWKLNEDLLPDVEEINMLKLRLGWGQTGNANIGDYLWIDRINNPLETRYPFGLDEQVYYGGTIIRSFANPAVKWESTEMTNVGMDLSMFNNRVFLTAEYYYKNQDGMLIELEQYNFFGRVSARQPVNIGQIVNKGVELNLTYKQYFGQFFYAINGNVTTINNTVKALPSGEPLFQNNTVTQEGYPIGSFYGWVAERIIQENDFDEDGTYLFASQDRNTAPGDIKFKDLNQDGIIDAEDQTIIGNPVPELVYGLNIDMSFRNFDFNVFFEGVYGNHIYNGLRSEIGLATEPATKNWNRLTDVLDYWTPENPSTTMTRANVVDPNQNNRISTWFVEDGSYLRIKNLQLGYTFPKQWLPKIQSFRLYVSATNLLTISGYSGLNPEINSSNPTGSGFDWGTYPIPRNYLGGIQVNF